VITYAIALLLQSCGYQSFLKQRTQPGAVKFQTIPVLAV
jgi:hypothetical protein